jgi:hypothetical protein
MRGDTRASRIRANVKTGLVKAEASGNCLDGPDHRSEQASIQGRRVQDGQNMLFGNDDNMDIGMMFRMVKRQDQIILPDFIDLNLPREDILTIPVASCHGLLILVWIKKGGSETRPNN